MKISTIFLCILSLSFIGCKPNKSRPLVKPLDLEGFSAASSSYHNIDVTVDFPADTSSYTAVSIYRSTTATPDCGSGTLVQTITDFSVDPLVINDDVGNSLTWYYRACPISSTYTFAETLPTTSASGGVCLIAGTQIATDLEGGSKNVEDIEIGDLIVSYNHDIEELEMKPVSHIFTSDEEVPYGELTLSNQIKLGLTTSHPIFVQNHENQAGSYVLSASLQQGDSLLFLALNNLSYIQVVEPITFNKKAYVYTLRVEDNHNYFAQGILVHNK